MSLMWSYGLPDEDMPGWVDDVAAAGYEGVATFSKVLLRLVAETDFRSRLAGHGLSLASVDTRVTDDLDEIRCACEVMSDMDAAHLVAIGGLAQRGVELGRVAEWLERMGEVSLEFGVRTCYHNHTKHAAETMEEVEVLLGATDSGKVAGFLDVGHATKDFVGHPAAKRAAVFLERNWERIGFLEFKDWSQEHDLCTEVGAGRCDYGAVFRILKDRGYSGWITVEQNGPSGDRSPLECAAASREFIRRGLEA